VFTELRRWSSQRTEARRTPMSRRLAVVLVGLLAAGGVVLAVAQGAGGARGQAAPDPGGCEGFGSGPSGLFTFARPIVGERVSLKRAESLVMFPVPHANVPAAARASLTNVFADPVKGHQAVALVYRRGAVDVVMSPALYRDPTSDFSGVIGAIDATASLRQVAGHVALVIEPDTNYFGRCLDRNPAWVEVDLHHVDVNVESAHQSATSLLAVANSLACDGCKRAFHSRYRVPGANGRIAGEVVRCRADPPDGECAPRKWAEVVAFNTRRQPVARQNVRNGHIAIGLPAGRYALVAVSDGAGQVAESKLGLYLRFVGVRARTTARVNLIVAQ
jgi:hypothetical protein